MNKKEFSVLVELRKNSRKHYTEIGRKTRIPLSTVFEAAARIKAIRRFTVLPDFVKLGFPIRMFLAVKARDRHEEDLRDFLEGERCINSLFRTNGNYDFFAEAIFKDMGSTYDFAEKIDVLCKAKRAYYITEVLKAEEFLAEKSHYQMISD